MSVGDWFSQSAPHLPPRAQGGAVNDTLQMPPPPPAPSAPPVAVADPVVEANRQLLLDRSRVGIEKYKTTLAAAGLSREQILQHLLEELLDAANYVQAELQRPRRVVAWRLVNGSGVGCSWVDGDAPDGTPLGWRIERAYSE